MQLPVYLDYNATTPVAQDVLEAMLPYFSQRFGNASSSIHVKGWEASAAVDRAREQVARLVGAEPVEIVFTSGATESINLAIKGTAATYRKNGNHIVCGATEHKAVLDTCAALERQGFDISLLPVDSVGQPRLDDLDQVLTEQTILVCLMWANNETGVVSRIRDVARLVHEKGILLMSDATQAVGKIPVDIEDVDLLALSAHKFYGPKGVGALYVRRRHPRVRLLPLLDGGGQERGLRGGTLNTPGIVGLGAAAQRASEQLDGEAARLSRLRDRLESGLLNRLEGVHVNGDRVNRLPGTSSLLIENAPSADLIAHVRSLAFSSSSACSSASGKPSHVLTAMGMTAEQAHSSIRLGVGQPTTDEAIDFAVDELVRGITFVRNQQVDR